MEFRNRYFSILVVGLFLALNIQCPNAETAIPTQAGDRLAGQQKTERGRVVKAGFTKSDFEDGPTEDLSEIINSVPEIFFFSDLDGMAGQTVTHRWKYGSSVIANAEIPVENSRFRAWSSYKMQPQWTGAWFVEIVDETGTVIATKTFAFMAPL